MLVRAYGDTDPRIQEEVLRRSVPLAKQLDVQVTTACYSFKVVTLSIWDLLMDLGCATFASPSCTFCWFFSLIISLSL